MKITVEQTEEFLTEIKGPVRVWKGETESGVPIEILVAAMRADTENPAELAVLHSELTAAGFKLGKIPRPHSANGEEWEDEEDPDLVRAEELGSQRLGLCCMCEHAPAVNVIMLDRRGAIPDHGWSCVTCGLPNDGALAVLCDPCLALWQEDESRLTIACRGFPAEEGRIPIAELPSGKFEHDMAKHPDG